MAFPQKLSWSLYRCIRGTVRLCYPKMKAEGLENLPEEPVIIVGNHCQMHGPIAAELYGPGEHYTWCAGQMMHREDVAEYAFQDFWSQKPRHTLWFYRGLSHLIAPLSVLIFNQANTIGVYHDSRILSTFKKTIAKLQDGANVIIFPEHAQDYNRILCRFQEKFVDVAKLYYRRTGKELAFVPLYIAPDLKKMVYGKPIRFRADAPVEEERERICRYLMEEITRMAVSLPEHRVVPYRNVSRKEYPSNRVKEDSCGKASD